MKLIRILLLLLMPLAPVAFSQEDSGDTQEESIMAAQTLEERKARLIEELRRRRELRTGTNAKASNPRQNDPARDGAVYQPREKLDTDLDSLTIHELPVGLAANIYANIKGKEVMVSSKVSDRRLNLELGKTSRISAIEAFEEELTKLGIKIIEPTDDLVVLVDDKEQPTNEVEATAVDAPN